ncbi:hypothetical protein [Geothrix fuzhouensis]|uniref:hypothetical protein n=1 Tax=Geothrix fuzhouensis TaxID=2966451 RepID=UPI00214961F7|nr:hypothetical protein [Geothrix fuzhouensis]
MRFGTFTLLLVSAATAVQAEDCPLVLNQRFQLRYNQWQSSQMATTSTTQAIYEVEAGIPIFTYRLGALALNGAVEYNRLAYSNESGAEIGLNRYGARISLFPYRPVHLYLDYQHTQSPDLLGSGSLKGETWGAGLRYANRILGDVFLTYRHGEARLEGGATPNAYRDEWAQWKLETHHRFAQTQVDFEALRQDYAPLGTPAWRYTTLNLDTSTFLARDWKLRTRAQAQESGASRWSNFSASLYGPISGAWHSLTNVSTDATATGSVRTATSFTSESLVYESGRWYSHATGSYGGADTPAQERSERTSSLLMGGSYTLNPEWRLHGDAGLSYFQRSLVTQDDSKSISSLNLGIARGGDVPELIRHSLFFLSDWNFDRKMREEYPPDFVPTELAQELLRRRMRQTGSFGFTADLWRMSDSSTEGTLDWARVTGQVQTRSDLAFYLMGDFKHDKGLTQPGLDLRSTDLQVNGSYRMGPTTLTASLGYSDGYQSQTAVSATNPAPFVGNQVGLSRHYSAGATTRLWRVPVGALLLRYDASMNPSTTTLSAWADLSFRQVSLRVRYQTSRTDGGFRNDSINVDLLRWFDTICVRNWR